MDNYRRLREIQDSANNDIGNEFIVIQEEQLQLQ